MQLEHGIMRYIMLRNN